MKKSTFLNIFSIFCFPLFFIILIWTIKIIEIGFDTSFIQLGLFPQKISGLKGIFLSPLIHKDFNHLLNNSYPLLVLGGMLFHFYKKIAWKLLFLLCVVSGFWLWIIGRPSFHIGASGLIYSLASFLFISGIIKKDPRLYSISMLIVFLYGSMIWGILPTKEEISWEGHLSGFLAGILIALFYKNDGPQRKKHQWEIDEELEEKQQAKIKINYTVIDKHEP